MKKMFIGAFASFVAAMALFTINASADPPDHAKGKAIGLSSRLVSGASGITGATGSGANNPGPYDPFEVCSPSGNGNHDVTTTSQPGPTGVTGIDPTTGKPCAGSVGNADGKNPPGQLPGPGDSNKGYECDENSGVAQGNPAHSFCQPTATTLPRTTTTVPVTTTSVAVVTTSSTIPTEVEGEQADNISISAETKSKAAPLAMTGGDVLLVAGLGSVALAGGVAFTLGSKRK